MLRRISLANKCLLLFGLAVVLIVTAALSVAWVRMNVVIDEGELATARRTVLLWDTLRQRAARSSTDESATGLASERLFVEEAALSFVRGDQPGLTTPSPSGPSPPPPAASPPAASPPAAPAEPPSTVRPPDEFVRRAIAAFAANPSLTELWDVDWGLSARVYAYARPVRGLPPPAPQSGPAPASSETAAGSAAPNQPGVYIYRKTSRDAASAMWLNLAFLASVGVATLGLAVLVFYLITNKIILQPVRQLRATAEDVRQGELDVRSDIQTGDEFEELAEAFNEMLAGLSQSQAQLRAINTALDEKINQLSERNNMLFEAARVKGEFLANITHELRTPLNSILGFAELLDETAARDELTARAQTAAVSVQPADGQPAAGQLSPGQTSPGQLPSAQLSPEDVAAFSARIVKRRRYIDNILSAGRNLLELINSLLEMAKVEAGKVELRLKEVNPKDLCEQLAAMMRPQADKRNVELRLEVPDTQPPNLITDAGKLQQIIFNLLSNAVKFTGDMADEQRAAAAKRAYEQPESAVIVEHQHPAVVTLRLEHLITRDPETGQTHDKLRFCVLDSGPGIAPEDQRRIFDKFTQLDSGYGRKHAGTGLGLAICKELTSLLQGEISVQSELNRGSMFSVILPLARDQKLAAESRLEQVFRGQLSATKPEQPA